MLIFPVSLGRVNLKVSSALLHISLPASPCLPSAVPARAHLGKRNRRGKEQLRPAPTSPGKVFELEHHLHGCSISLRKNLFAEPLY